MKKIISLGVLLAIVLCTRAQSKQVKVNLYDLDLTFLDGKELDLKTFKGRKILFVNVASKCGFTPQYEG
ncbi:MAG: glutathione peroxidase, partial [Crocinitomicaceae bacterium]|nr:glutathione peroxidase [Crocinitomicaceae bacterium]